MKLTPKFNMGDEVTLDPKKHAHLYPLMLVSEPIDPDTLSITIAGIRPIAGRNFNEVANRCYLKNIPCVDKGAQFEYYLCFQWEDMVTRDKLAFVLPKPVLSTIINQP